MVDVLEGACMSHDTFAGSEKSAMGKVALKNGALTLKNESAGSGFAVLCWVNPKFTGTEMGIFGGGNWNTGPGNTPTKSGYLHCTLNPRQPYFGFGFNDLNSNKEIPHQEWSSLAFVYDAKKGKRILINGEVANSDTKTIPLCCTTGNLFVGKAPHCPGFRGEMAGLMCLKGVFSDDVVNLLLSATDPRRSQENMTISQFPSTAPQVEVDDTPFERTFFPESTLDEATVAVAQEQREEIEVIIADDPEGKCNYAPLQAFEELVGVLPTYVFSALEENGWQAPLPVQAQALPIILGGHDLIGIAKTGSGKTLAFLIPAIVHIEAQCPIDKKAPTPIMLTLAPTRELVMQIMGEAQKLLSHSKEGSNHGPKGLGAASIIGGLKKGDQLRQASFGGCHILVATPGRLVDHLQNEEISLRRVTYFVLDEADRMLEAGFEGQVKSIAAHVRTDRQMCFFSATWPKAVQNLAAAMCMDDQQPIRIAVGQQAQSAGPTARGDITQEVIVFDQGSWDERDAAKKKMLYAKVREMLQYETNKVLVFASRKDLCDELCKTLFYEGITADAMHGGRSQEIRLNVLDKFRKSETRLLVTTDVMGRGIDIPDITHVLLYDMGEAEDYVHRIGRTARGPSGTGHALTFFEHNDRFPTLGDQLIKLLESAGQAVPAPLRKIAQLAREGKISNKEKKAWKQQDAGGGNGEWKEPGEWKKPGEWKEPGQWQEPGAWKNKAKASTDAGPPAKKAKASAPAWPAKASAPAWPQQGGGDASAGAWGQGGGDAWAGGDNPMAAMMGNLMAAMMGGSKW